MQVQVLFFGPLKDIVGRAEEGVTIEEGSSVGQLYELYRTRFPKLAAHASSILFSRNREFVREGEGLQDGDEVAFLPPVSGGSPGAPEGTGETPQAGVLQRLTRAPIDTQALVKELQQGEDGAVVVFEGIVRNHSGHRRTLYLEYEAYEPMALAKMCEITREVKQKFAVDRVAIVHRLGHLEIGEASVVIVLTAAHRRPAFEACQYAIDRLKRIVPIWKREFFEDGAVWVEGEQNDYAVSDS